KTHRINTKYKNDDTRCFSINDKLNISTLTSSFLSFDMLMSNNPSPSIYLNISIHAPFEDLNRTLFLLFICGVFIDYNSGLIYSLSKIKSWKFIIEIPYSDKFKISVKENFEQILPILSIINPFSLEEVTSDNYPLFIGEQEELVARFLKAFENHKIDNMMKNEKPISFEPITNSDEARQYIYNCINKNAFELPQNKLYELSFTKFLYRRIRFFTGHFYCLNETIKNLGSTVMKQIMFN
ncbi:unnamed protein product, partial [Didymodactylos carnosus]